MKAATAGEKSRKSLAMRMAEQRPTKARSAEMKAAVGEEEKVAMIRESAVVAAIAQNRTPPLMRSGVRKRTASAMERSSRTNVLGVM